MHRRGVSPTGEFGFPITTHAGRVPQTFPMSKSWEDCFSQIINTTFEKEQDTHGPDEEFLDLRNKIMTLVIPRLLRPLETEGKTLTPRLVHGDLWDGNASIDVNSGTPLIFDPLPLYAHNECKESLMALPALESKNRAFNSNTVLTR